MRRNNKIEEMQEKTILLIISKINNIINNFNKIIFGSNNDKHIVLAELKIIINYLEIYMKTKNKKILSENLKFLFEDEIIITFKKYLGKDLTFLQENIKAILNNYHINQIKNNPKPCEELELIDRIITTEKANNILNFINNKNGLGLIVNQGYHIEGGIFKLGNQNLAQLHILEIKLIKQNNYLILIGENQLQNEFIILGKIKKGGEFDLFNSTKKLSNFKYNKKLGYISGISNGEYFLVDLESFDIIFGISEIKKNANGRIYGKLKYRQHHPRPRIMLYNETGERKWQSGKIINILTKK